jgi:tetratricopeptide (TPR) repeat protein
VGGGERAVPIVPYAALALAGILTFLKLIATDGVIEAYPKGGLAAVLLTNAVLFRDYALHVVFPLRHQAIYDVRFVQSPLDPAFLGAMALLGAISFAAWRFRRIPWAPFAATFFFINFIPYLNIVPHGIYYAERYLYLPSIAFALLLGLLGAVALERVSLSRPARLAVAGALCVFLAAHVAVASHRNRAWADSETFWSYQASALPGSPAPLMNLGETRELTGNDPLAARTYDEVLARFGEVPEALYRLGRIARRQGDLDAAERIYERHARLCPDDPRPLNNWAEVHLARGETDQAIAIYERLTRSHPRYLLARANLARTLDSAGRRAEAEAHWRFVVEHAELLPQAGLVEEARARLPGGR